MAPDASTTAHRATTPDVRSRRRQFIVAALALSTLISLLTGAVIWHLAIAARPIYLQEPGHEKTGHKYLYDPVTGWRNIPNWQATTFGQPLTINSQGLRDREYSLEKAAGTCRILVLGDSYTWGYGVGDHEIFTEVLEQQLQSDKHKCEVINAGVSGWGTDQEYLFLKHEGFQYSPDVVVLAFFLANDPKNNWYNRQYGLWKPLFANRQLDLISSPVPLPHDKVSIRTSTADMYELTAAIIEQMATECSARGIELIVMKFGVFLDPDNQNLCRADRWMAAAFAEMPNVHVLDLDQEFRNRDLSATRLLEGNHDGHWNTFGHAQTANILKEFLKSRGTVLK